MGSPRTLGLVLAVGATATAGCGGDGGRQASRAPATSERAPATAPHRTSRLDPAIVAPRRVPRHGTGPADPGAARVIRGWLRELRHGRIRRAAAYFAIPSVFQNGTPVLHLDSTLEVLAVNVSFPCGAVATSMRRAGPFTIVRFRLTARTNGACDAEGLTTGGAIRVAHGRIREWYRLYDPDEPGPPPAQIDPGPEAA